MNVMVCASCGRRLTEPVRRLDEMPERPAWDGGPDADGRRHGPASVPRGAHVVDPRPFGAPFVPVAGDEEYDGIAPGERWTADCSGGYETRLVPDTVRVDAVQDVEATG
ncbi:hypothetical protein ABZ876_20845 [Streptomyces sp. NPDC046931]|uniref:hypothetical protein n=1 Tax=Streptomyces sp. NPDC046931 TaxID=3154806 RepID=UPI0033E0D8A0